MKLIIDIPKDIRVAIGQMGLLRIPNEMQKTVDKAIQHSTPIPDNATVCDIKAIQAEKTMLAIDKDIIAKENKRLNNAIEQIRAEIEDIAFDWQEIDGEHESFMVVDLNDVLKIIDRHMKGEQGC